MNPSDPAPNDGAPRPAADEPDSLEKRLAFLGLTEEDAQRLRDLRPAFREYAEEFVAAFYRHLFAFAETASFLQDEERVKYLKRAQRAHFASLLEGKWDTDYLRQRQQVGHVHADVGIEPQWFLGAYNQYVQLCVRRFAASDDMGKEECLEHLLSLMKAIFLDVGLTLDAYFAGATRSLRQALDMYWKANTNLRQFARLASHDLKTPLATVANLCDEVLDEFREELPDEAADLLEKAKDRTYRMGSMINELLDSALAEQSTDINDLISSERFLQDAIDRARPELEQRGIELVVPSSLPEVWGNRVRLREAFYNLLSNAAKFIENDHGRIEIRIEERPDDCVFKICDNGPGIPPEELERIFVPFRRLPSHRKLPGSGLGLYFTKNLIEVQGGRVWAESQIGKGSCFHVQLPRRPVEGTRVRRDGHAPPYAAPEAPDDWSI